MVLRRRLLFAVSAVSAIASAVAAGGGLIYGETSSVKILIPPQRLEADITLTGGQAAGNLHTQHIQASFTDSLRGTASTVQIGAKYAAGEVVFTCSPCLNLPLTIPQGTVVTYNTLRKFATEVPVTITTSTGSTPVGVHATAAGTEWNADPNTVTTILNSPDASLHVTNLRAIAGGANARSGQVIQQSDFDAVRSALSVTVNDHLDGDLKAPGRGLTYIANLPPVITLQSDHGVGEETPTFTITMTGTISAFAFSESEAQTLERAALMAQLPRGQELTSDPVQMTLHGWQGSGSGDVILLGKAAGCVIPKLSAQSLRSQIAGLTSAQAAQSLQRAAHGSSIEIQVSPSTMPWLPLVEEHISIKLVVEPGFDPVYSLSGTVPVGATTAIVGLRVNQEGAGPGKADFTIDGMAYRQNGEWLNRVPNPDFALNMKGWGLAPTGATLRRSTRGCAGTGLHFTATSNQSIQLNSTEFKVAAGAPFTATFASRIAPVSMGSGYFAVMFLGPGATAPSERGITRERISFAAAPTS